MLINKALQVPARKVLHHVIEHPFWCGAEVENLHGVPVGQSSGHPNLPLKPSPDLRTVGMGRPQQFDSAGPTKELVLGKIHFAHTTSAELPPELVLAEPPVGERFCPKGVQLMGAVHCQHSSNDHPSEGLQADLGVKGIGQDP